MLSTLISLSLAAVAFPQATTTLPAGTQLVLRGGVSELRPDRSPDDPKKTFDLTMLVTSWDESGCRAYWLVEERGKGTWPWIERFGELTLDPGLRPVGAPGPAVLYDYGPGRAAIGLLAPMFKPQGALAEGSKWEADGFRYEVEGQADIDGAKAWTVRVEDNVGRKRTIGVLDDAPLVAELDERVFMNQGTEYRLQMSLVGREELPPEQFAATASAFAALVELRQKLNRPAQSDDPAFTPLQREELTSALPPLADTIKAGPLVKLVRAASRDLELQTGRADSIAELAAEFVGREVESFSIPGLGREKLSSDALEGKVSILHFWDYRDEPLEEPYGQVGYLEFLHSRHKEAGLKVYGVAVDGRFGEETTRGAATAGVRKLKNFMNLSYPIALDGGELIKQFGDPRLLGAALPLFVVIDRDGKIVHYHVGHYEVDKLEGLKELDQIVGGVLKKKS